MKKHCSAVVVFESHEEAQKALNHKLLIADVAVRTAKFEEKRDSEQCSKCQKFGHSVYSCKNQAACQLCAQNHFTRLHMCKICEISGQNCIHTQLKCSNCAGNHAANSIECSTVVAAKKLNS